MWARVRVAVRAVIWVLLKVRGLDMRWLWLKGFQKSWPLGLVEGIGQKL